MSARAWRARKTGAQSQEAQAERAQHLSCRHPGCLMNRKHHWAHFVPETIPDFAYGTNRLGRRRARKRGLFR